MFSEMCSSIATAAKISFPGCGVMRTHHQVKFITSLLKTANELSCGETSSSKCSCLAERSCCSQLWIPVPCPFPDLTTFAGLPGAWVTSGERDRIGIDQSCKVCKLVLFLLLELYRVPVPSARGVVTAFRVSHLSANRADLGRKCVPTA